MRDIRSNKNDFMLMAFQFKYRKYTHERYVLISDNKID